MVSTAMEAARLSRQSPLTLILPSTMHETMYKVYRILPLVLLLVVVPRFVAVTANSSGITWDTAGTCVTSTGSSIGFTSSCSDPYLYSGKAPRAGGGVFTSSDGRCRGKWYVITCEQHGAFLTATCCMYGLGCSFSVHGVLCDAGDTGTWRSTSTPIPPQAPWAWRQKAAAK